MNPTALRGALHEAAERAPQPRLAEAAIRTAQRRRRRRLVAVPAVAAAVAAVAAVVALGAAVVLPGETAVAPADRPAAVAALPASVDEPFPWTRSVVDSPLARGAYVIPDVTDQGAEALVGTDGTARLFPLGGGSEITVAALSPDGFQLAYASPTETGSGVTKTAELRIVDLRSATTRAVELPGRDLGTVVQELAWSPRGDRLALSALVVESRQQEGGGTTESGSYDLLTLDLGTLRLQRIDSSTGSVAWSPDGTRLARLSIDAGTTLDVIDAGSGDRVDRLSVPADADLDAGAWSPDGGEIVLTRRVGPASRPGEQADAWQLVRVPLDGAARRTVPLGGHWNPWIVGWRGARPVLQAVDVDGTAVLQAVDLATGRRSTLAQLPGMGTQEVVVARDLLATAPLVTVDVDQSPWWSPRAVRWWLGQLSWSLVVAQLLLLALAATIVRRLVRGGRRALTRRRSD